jgi:hypothetical protein
MRLQHWRLARIASCRSLVTFIQVDNGSQIPQVASSAASGPLQAFALSKGSTATEAPPPLRKAEATLERTRTGRSASRVCIAGLY